MVVAETLPAVPVDPAVALVVETHKRVEVQLPVKALQVVIVLMVEVEVEVQVKLVLMSLVKIPVEKAETD
jgi:hypothetical protein